MNYRSHAQSSCKCIYQCDDNFHKMVKSTRDHLHNLCNQHANHLIKVETIDGDVFEGHIVRCERGVLFLRLSHEGYGENRFFGPGPFFPNPYANNVILPLVLFNLLTISLLY